MDGLNETSAVGQSSHDALTVGSGARRAGAERRSCSPCWKQNITGILEGFPSRPANQTGPAAEEPSLWITSQSHWCLTPLLFFIRQQIPRQTLRLTPRCLTRGADLFSLRVTRFNPIISRGKAIPKERKKENANEGELHPSSPWPSINKPPSLFNWPLLFLIEL